MSRLHQNFDIFIMKNKKQFHKTPLEFLLLKI